MNIKQWNDVTERLPEEGILCIVYHPMGEDRVTGKTSGPIAMAYYRKDEGWIYADQPTPLRFKPCYWLAWDKR